MQADHFGIVLSPLDPSPLTVRRFRLQGLHAHSLAIGQRAHA